LQERLYKRKNNLNPYQKQEVHWQGLLLPIAERPSILV
jgi:hypothetical protein